MEKIKNKEYHKCKECGLFYRKMEWAKKCEEWCKENKSCNLVITKHALKEKK